MLKKLENLNEKIKLRIYGEDREKRQVLLHFVCHNNNMHLKKFLLVSRAYSLKSQMLYA
jgi:hypothetical protein